MDKVKPANCTCAYPDLVARNMSGHAFDCPVHVAFRTALERRQEEAVNACTYCKSPGPHQQSPLGPICTECAKTYAK